MGNSPQPQIQLDQSTFMPLDPATQPRQRSVVPVSSSPVSAPSPDYSHVQLDPSTFSPVGGNHPDLQQPEKPYNPAEHGALSRFGHAFAAPFKAMAHGAFDEPEDVNEVVAHAQGGQTGLIAYRAAKKLIEAHDAMSKAERGPSFRQAVLDFQNAAIDYSLGHKYDALQHAVSGGVSTIKGTQPELGPLVLDRARSISEGATKGGDLATPLGGVAADVAMGAATYGAGRGFSALRGAVEAGEAGTATEEAVAGARAVPKTPVETAVERGVAKSGLTTGTPATTAPTGEAIQPGIQKGVRDVFSGVAKDSGVEASSAKSIRGVVEETANNVLAKSKGLYKQIDTATGGKFQPNADALKNVNDELRATAGLDDAKEAALMAKKTQLEWQQEKMFEEAATKGVSKEAVDAAKASYKKAQALYDTDAAIKASTTGRTGVGKGIEIVDPKKLVPRLHKLYDSGRLQQAVGEDGANAFIEHAENAHTAMQEIKDFVPSSPTGKNALQDILAKNTAGKSSLFRGGKIVGETDWNGAVKDFENLGADQQAKMFGADVPRVRQFLGRQALKQNAIKVLKYGGIPAAGVATEEALRHSL